MIMIGGCLVLLRIVFGECEFFVCCVCWILDIYLLVIKEMFYGFKMEFLVVEKDFLLDELCL